MMLLNFVTVDVFTDFQFGGNPLAVVLNAEGLSTEQMQSIAAEFNLSETTFVLPPKDPAHTAHVRIFTPRAEMPFAGHPNVGTAFVLGRAGQSYGQVISGPHLVFEEQAGLVRLELLKDGGAVLGARISAPQAFSIGDNIAPELVASACGLPTNAIVTKAHTSCIASCGAPFILAEVTDRRALAQATPRTDVFNQHFLRDQATGVLLYTHVDKPNLDIQCRMFAPLHGIPEDPATGSANVALIGLLAKLRAENDLTLDLSIMQGVEMGRPSLMQASALKKDGHVTHTFIGGQCVPMMTGTLQLA
jgi:trans-2,3-dihydro-3-hydroxyanthranilate isomerase